MLNCLTGSKRPEIPISTHQCTCFNVNFKSSREQAVMLTGRYHMGSKNNWISYIPDNTHCLEVFVDADFAGDVILIMHWTQITYTRELYFWSDMLDVLCIGKENSIYIPVWTYFYNAGHFPKREANSKLKILIDSALLN